MSLITLQGRTTNKIPSVNQIFTFHGTCHYISFMTVMALMTWDTSQTLRDTWASPDIAFKFHIITGVDYNYRILDVLCVGIVHRCIHPAKLLT